MGTQTVIEGHRDIDAGGWGDVLIGTFPDGDGGSTIIEGPFDWIAEERGG